MDCFWNRFCVWAEIFLCFAKEVIIATDPNFKSGTSINVDCCHFFLVPVNTNISKSKSGQYTRYAFDID